MKLYQKLRNYAKLESVLSSHLQTDCYFKSRARWHTLLLANLAVSVPLSPAANIERVGLTRAVSWVVISNLARDGEPSRTSLSDSPRRVERERYRGSPC